MPSVFENSANFAGDFCPKRWKMNFDIEDVKNWQYFAEGGGHLLLVYQSTSGEADSESGRFLKCNPVLRIPKFHQHQTLAENHPFLLDPKAYCVANQQFTISNMNKWFSDQYISDCLLIDLSLEWLDSIIRKVNDLRPKGRKKKPLHLFPVGYVESNILLFPPLFSSPRVSLSPPRQPMTMGWEIKLKSGLKSISTFLSPSNYAKLFYSRYYLTQYYKEFTANQSPLHQLEWGQFSEQSIYQPNHLCSSNPCLIQSAVNQLIHTPQNNLGVFLNGSRCYGWDISDRSCFHQSLQQFFQPLLPIELTSIDSSASSQGSSFSNPLLLQKLINKVYSSVIYSESVMKSIEKLQTLDFVDAEGIAFFYEKGNSFYSNNRIKFEEDLLGYLSRPLEDSMMKLSSKFYEYHYPSLESEQNEREQLEEQVQSLQLSSSLSKLILLALQRKPEAGHSSSEEASYPSLSSDFLQWRDELLQKSLHLLDELSISDIFYVLKLWMLASIAKDCSIMITIRYPAHFELNKHNNHSLLNSLLSKLSEETEEEHSSSLLFPVKNFRDSSSYGKVYLSDKVKEISEVEVDEDFYFEYKIHLIDIGLKDFSKFYERRDKDTFICEIFEKSGSQSTSTQLTDDP
jgi:hypothetical protein